MVVVLLYLTTPLARLNLVPNMDLKKLKNQLRIHEGYRTKVYLDSVGVATVGVGFNLERLDAFGCLQRVGADFKSILKGQAILTDEQIDKLLSCGVRKVDNTAREYVANYDQLDDVRQRVVCDMLFNLGLGGFLKFEKDLTDSLPTDTPEKDMGTIDLVEAGRFDEAAVRMLKTKWAKQVGNRATILSRMMKTGVDVYAF